jgi:hypothetical protein
MGEQRCITFVPDPSKTPDCFPDQLPVVQNQHTCDAVTTLLQNSVQTDAQPIFIALISAILAENAVPTELVACGSQGWECSGALDSSVDEIESHSGHIIDTPGSVHILSTRYPR